MQGTGSLEGADRVKQVCFEMRDRGTCSRGKECKYVHDRSVVEEARKRVLRDKKSARDGNEGKGEKPTKHSTYRSDDRKGGKGTGSKGDKDKATENLRNPVGFSTLLGVAHVVPSAHFCMKALAAPRGARGQGCSS